MPEYQTWKNMVARCHGRPGPKQRWYADKGITVCDRWRYDFNAFLEDMGVRPQGKTIDRINGSLGYFKENCRWATPREQSRNQSDRVCVAQFEFSGHTGTIEHLFAIVRPEMTFKRFQKKLYNLRYRTKVSAKSNASPQ